MCSNAPGSEKFYFSLINQDIDLKNNENRKMSWKVPIRPKAPSLNKYPRDEKQTFSLLLQGVSAEHFEIA